MLKIYQKYYFSLKSHYFLYLFVRYILRFWELTHQSGDSPNERVQFPFVVAGKVYRLKLITLKIPQYRISLNIEHPSISNIPQYRTSLNLKHLETSVFPEHPPILNNPSHFKHPSILNTSLSQYPEKSIFLESQIKYLEQNFLSSFDINAGYILATLTSMSKKQRNLFINN